MQFKIHIKVEYFVIDRYYACAADAEIVHYPAHGRGPETECI